MLYHISYFSLFYYDKYIEVRSILLFAISRENVT